MTDAVLEEVLLRLRRLEDERAILDTLHRYAHAHYSGDKAQYLDCFTATATIEHSRRGCIGAGHDGLAGLFDRIPHAPAVFHKNVLVEPIVRIDGDTATVTADYVYIQEGPTGPYISNFGHYDDELVREADGAWRFTCRRIESEVAATDRAAGGAA